ncbi:MAG: DNA translocase FtsK 4TM domain-containing protein, partial [Candidatus Sumerlaeia bacterium]|nr:DNA translocase FtsK 4TM domain-containing protein [Candidatus Sumerlaeia bacterium]
MAELTVSRQDHTQDETPEWRRTGPGWKAFWELLGISLGLVALFIMASLSVSQASAWSTGEAGAAISRALRFLVGNILAFAVPIVLIWAGVMLFMGKRLPWSPTRFVGVLLLFPALAGLMALPFADEPDLREAALARAGVIGVYMVDWHGLRLVGQFGTIGAAMTLLAGALAGLVMTTHQPLTALGRSIYALVRQRRGMELPEAEGTIAPPP